MACKPYNVKGQRLAGAWQLLRRPLDDVYPHAGLKREASAYAFLGADKAAKLSRRARFVELKTRQL